MSFKKLLRFLLLGNSSNVMTVLYIEDTLDFNKLKVFCKDKGILPPVVYMGYELGAWDGIPDLYNVYCLITYEHKRMIYNGRFKTEFATWGPASSRELTQAYAKSHVKFDNVDDFVKSFDAKLVRSLLNKLYPNVAPQTTVYE